MKKKRNPAKILITLAVFTAIALGALITGTAMGRTTMLPELALDLQGGTQLILTPTAREGEGNVEVTENDLQEAIRVIRQRIDASGVAEAEITSQGRRNIVVSLPGNPSDETLNLVRSSAIMRLRPVLLASGPEPVGAAVSQDPSASPAPTTKPVSPEEAADKQADLNQDGTISAERTAEPENPSDLSWMTEQMYRDFLLLDCTDTTKQAQGSDHDPAEPLVACQSDGKEKYVLGPAELEGVDLESATAGTETNQQGQSTGKWVVYLNFGAEGTDKFFETSKRLVSFKGTDPVRNRFATVLDGRVIVAPTMNSEIANGKAVIEGSFTAETARSLANQLQFGSLPLNFTVESERRISATLGADHLMIGLWTGLIGLALVVLYLVWQYRGLAVLAAGSLAVAAAIVYLAIALLSWLMGYRLSLAGVTGLIIAVGITADSFIVYFERIRDEVRDGSSLAGAVRQGWERARRTIIVSDMVNLLAAAVLYFLAVGGVQGFAFTLGLTTIVDLIVILMFTHPMMELLIRTKFYGQGHRLSGLDPEHLGAASRAVYAGRGRVTTPRKGRADRTGSASDLPEVGRVSIAEKRRRQELGESETEPATATAQPVTETGTPADEPTTATESDATTDASTTGEEPK